MSVSGPLLNPVQSQSPVLPVEKLYFYFEQIKKSSRLKIANPKKKVANIFVSYIGRLSQPWRNFEVRTSQKLCDSLFPHHCNLLVIVFPSGFFILANSAQLSKTFYWLSPFQTNPSQDSWSRAYFRVENNFFWDRVVIYRFNHICKHTFSAYMVTTCSFSPR